MRMKRHDIATNGSCCAVAETLGLDRIKQILKETLSEEEATDKKLSQIRRA
jgi:ferritin-like metal-binding protein YciE